MIRVRVLIAKAVFRVLLLGTKGGNRRNTGNRLRFADKEQAGYAKYRRLSRCLACKSAKHALFAMLGMRQTDQLRFLQCWRKKCHRADEDIVFPHCDQAWHLRRNIEGWIEIKRTLQAIMRAANSLQRAYLLHGIQIGLGEKLNGLHGNSFVGLVNDY